MEQIQHKAVPTEAKVISLGRIMKVAAAVIVLVGATMFAFNQMGDGGLKVADNGDTTYIDTEEDPVQAYLELKAALALVSNKLDDGKKQAIKGLSRTKSISIIK